MFGTRRALLNQTVNRLEGSISKTTLRIPGLIADWDMQDRPGSSIALARDASGLNSALDAANTNTTPGQSATNALGLAYEFSVAAHPFCNIYSAALNAAVNRTSGTISLFAKVANAGIWTDVILHELLILFIDGSNLWTLRKPTTNNTLYVEARGSGTAKAITTTTSTLDYFNLILTWDSGTITMDFNGTLINTVAGVGAISGALSATRCAIGANAQNSLEMEGFITQVDIWDRALTQSERAIISKAGGTS